MPRLLVFAPCEKVIISQDENTPTLISILTGMQGELQIDNNAPPIGPETHAPMRWTIFSMWMHEAGDENKEFEQVIKVMSPSGRPALSNPAEFKLAKGNQHRVNIHLQTVPIGEPGLWTIELYLRVKGDELPTTPLAIYPFRIEMIVTKTK